MINPETIDFPDLIYPICAVRDNLTRFYPCTVEDSVKSAIRNFSMAINSGNGTLNFSPADFTLFHIGNYNSSKGTIEPLSPIVQLVNGLSVFTDEKMKGVDFDEK